MGWGDYVMTSGIVRRLKNQNPNLQILIKEPFNNTRQGRDIFYKNPYLTSIDKFKEKADVFLLKRSFNNNVVVPKIFRGLEFLKHKDKSYADLYPFVACLVICNNADFWIKCLSYFNQIEPIYKIWFGDQEILRKMVNNNDFKFGFIEERDFGCPPQNLSGKTRPFLIHFKGKINKDIIKKYYQYV
ncbi:hypothetical protein OA258_04100 [Pelagibacteraceae bacterium]|nr:hypothetical protein [Pelagibacteraceae bacterium]